ncbi:DUF7269 family protein [Haloarcula amylovorans]
MSRTLVSRLLVITGFLFASVGFFVLYRTPVVPVAQWPWDDNLVVAGFTAIAFSVALLLIPVVIWDESDEESATSLTSPETVPSTPTPGDEIEQALHGRWLTLLPPDERTHLRRQLRQTAIRIIATQTNSSAEIAQKRLERGTWTDDSVAAAFFRTDSRQANWSLQSLRTRVHFRRQARRTARILLEYDSEEEPEQ